MHHHFRAASLATVVSLAASTAAAQPPDTSAAAGAPTPVTDPAGGGTNIAANMERAKTCLVTTIVAPNAAATEPIIADQQTKVRIGSWILIKSVSSSPPAPAPPPAQIAADANNYAICIAGFGSAAKYLAVRVEISKASGTADADVQEFFFDKNMIGAAFHEVRSARFLSDEGGFAGGDQGGLHEGAERPRSQRPRRS
jgi:hypothetical protein